MMATNPVFLGITVEEFGSDCELKPPAGSVQRNYNCLFECYNPDLFSLCDYYECIRDAKSKSTWPMLSAKFWQEGELAVLLITTTTGQRGLAVQIDDNLSRNHSPPDLPVMDVAGSLQKVKQYFSNHEHSISIHPPVERAGREHPRYRGSTFDHKIRGRKVFSTVKSLRRPSRQ